MGREGRPAKVYRVGAERHTCAHRHKKSIPQVNVSSFMHLMGECEAICHPKVPGRGCTSLRLSLRSAFSSAVSRLDWRVVFSRFPARSGAALSSLPLLVWPLPSLPAGRVFFPWPQPAIHSVARGSGQGTERRMQSGPVVSSLTGLPQQHPLVTQM